ncbi:MAG: hypothetical protein KTR14_04225 [Vampirovibrio sp.]|nr:hypothetical protein [Vampirovibrio sp.]
MSALAHPNLHLAAQILFRTFLIGFVLMLISWCLFVTFKPVWMDLMLFKWQLGNPELLEGIILTFYLVAKFFLFFFCLIPSLAIRWTLKKLEG